MSKRHPMLHTAGPSLFAPLRTSISRRRFLRQTVTAAAGFGFANLAPRGHAGPRNKLLPNPHRSGIEHIVLAMMENRSFDHFLGWLPSGNGRQAGLTYSDSNGVRYSTYPLAPDYQGCDHPDPAHDYAGARIQYDRGACDGWLRTGTNDVYPIGYYTEPDLPFLGQAAQAWTTADNYFAAILSATFPNRIYQHAAQTDRLNDTLLPLSTLPTIWDRLAEHSLTGRYYFSDVPVLALWGATYLPISSPLEAFFTDCAAGTLPHVSFVDPLFFGEAQGLSNDDHPHADIRNGEAFLNQIYEAVTSSPNWPGTVLVINFDEWGGFFDHVPPTTAPLPPADAALGSDGLRGFRVPAVVISPWSPRQSVAHGLYDHTSVLKLIEWRWSLRPLTIRDATANNLAEVLDFNHADLSAPQFNVPTGPFGSVCAGSVAVETGSEALRQLAAGFGFSVPSPSI